MLLLVAGGCADDGLRVVVVAVRDAVVTLAEIGVLTAVELDTSPAATSGVFVTVDDVLAEVAGTSVLAVWNMSRLTTHGLGMLLIQDAWLLGKLAAEVYDSELNTYASSFGAALPYY
jgi:hypothetical protein